MDWANHYLGRSGVCRQFGALEKDVRDGTLLALLIEAVLQCKVPAVNFNPTTPQHMVSVHGADIVDYDRLSLSDKILIRIVILMG